MYGTLGGGGGRVSWEFLAGVCHPVLQMLTLFQTKQESQQGDFNWAANFLWEGVAAHSGH